VSRPDVVAMKWIDAQVISLLYVDEGVTSICVMDPFVTQVLELKQLNQVAVIYHNKFGDKKPGTSLFRFRFCD
jgi:hypothetical protein